MPRCKPQSQQSHGARGIDRGLEYRFFGGKIIIGPDYKSLLLSTTLILVPSVVYFIFVAPYLGSHMSWAFVVITALLVIFVFSMLGLTAMGDPGFIPRSPPNSDVEFGIAPPTRDFFINGYTITTKFCATCCHYRPPRCSHCAVCDNCVDRFDHHCPWVGTCVGRRNYRTFFLFIVSTTVLCCWVVATCIVQLWKAAGEEDGDWASAIGRYPASLVLVIYCFAVVWFVGGLSCLHLWLIAKNMTTYEHFRHRYSNTGNPYSRGWGANFVETLCAKTPPRWEALYAKQKAEDDANANASAVSATAAAAAAAATTNDNSNSEIHDDDADVHDGTLNSNPPPFLSGPNYDGSVPPSFGGRSSTYTSEGDEDGDEDEDGYAYTKGLPPLRSPTFAVEIENNERGGVGDGGHLVVGGGGGGVHSTTNGVGRDIEMGAVEGGLGTPIKKSKSKEIVEGGGDGAGGLPLPLDEATLSMLQSPRPADKKLY